MKFRSLSSGETPQVNTLQIAGFRGEGLLSASTLAEFRLVQVTQGSVDEAV